MKKHGKRFLSFFIALSLVGCTSLKPVNMTTSELQKQISTGRVIHTNDKIKLETSSGKIQQFVVTGVTNTHVQGKNNSIPINTISSVKKVESSVGKTIGLTAIIFVVLSVAVAYTIFDSAANEIDN